MRSCTVLFGDLPLFLAVIFGFRFTVLIRLFTVMYGHIRSVSVMYVPIRLLSELVFAPQNSSLEMGCIYIPISTDGFIRYVSKRYVRKLRDTVCEISTAHLIWFHWVSI